MHDQFDELTKGLAQSVTRRGALKKFAVGLAGIALAALFAGQAHAADLYAPICSPSVGPELWVH